MYVLCGVLLVVCLLLAPTHQQMQGGGDLSDLSNDAQTCSSNPAPAMPINVQVTSLTAQSAMVSWEDPNSPSMDIQVLFWEVSNTSYRSQQVESRFTSAYLSDLNSFIRYWVRVRIVCETEGFGPLSDPVSFTTAASKPSVSVSNLTATANYFDVPNLVRIHWNHISHEAWNGNVGGYLVYVYRLPVRDTPVIPERQVNFPLNEEFLTLDSGQYAVVIVAFNAQGNQSNQLSAVAEFDVGAVSQGGGLEYPFVYIIVPGIIFVVIIIVVNVVIFKKVHETRRRSVTYCKELPGQRGYTNVIPLQERRSPSSSMSPPAPLGPTSPSVIVTQTSFVNRPLPLSPSSNGPSPTRQQRQQFIERDAQGAFGNGPPANFPAPKLPHPGPLPQLSDGSDTGFSPMQRTLTNQSASSVFSPTASVPPFSAQQRTRACTTGGDGMPSPYEIPEHNGSTLSRGDSHSVVRSASASAVQHRNIGQPPRGGNFPPPPSHSPPPLTHSSMELRARMDNGKSVLTSPPGQNTLPRTMGHHHSNAAAKPGPMKHIRSEGHFPIFEEQPDESKVYIQPLDSSVEASLHSGSGYGPSGVARKPSLEAAPYSYLDGLATNGSIVEAEGFRIEEGPIPRAPPPHNPTHHPRERSVRSHGRESLFSETSIELSVSSNSDREVSPSWDHRGATSDVGVGVLQGNSPSPEGARETVSEVGTGYKPHHVFKQFNSPNAHCTNHL